MLAITMTSGRTGHWTKMRRSLAPFSGSESSIHRDPGRTSSPLRPGLGFRYTQAVNPKDRTQGQDLFNVEYSLSPNWSAKVEYLHLDLGTASLFSAASISDDLVRAGVNYHW